MKKIFAGLLFVSFSISAFAQDKTADDSASKTPAPENKGPIAAYLDINYVFKNHPWTSATKKELSGQLQEKALEIEHVKEDIQSLQEEAARYQDYMDNLLPFYQKPKIEYPDAISQTENMKLYAQTADIINDLTFKSADIRFNSPLDSAALLDKTREELRGVNAKIKEKELYIETQRVETRDNIKQKEDVEVNEILQDIYNELKLYAQKRNIAIIVNKQDILYGQKPVDVTADFVDRLTKTRKSRGKQKGTDAAVVDLDANSQIVKDLKQGAAK